MRFVNEGYAKQEIVEKMNKLFSLRIVRFSHEYNCLFLVHATHTRLFLCTGVHDHLYDDQKKTIFVPRVLYLLVLLARPIISLSFHKMGCPHLVLRLKV